MPRVEEGESIPLPPAETWELLRNLELRPQWDASITEVRREAVGPDDGTLHLFYEAPLVPGLSWRWEGEYVSFQEPHRSAVRMIDGSFLRPFKSLVGTWVLQPDGDGTMLRMIVSFEPRLPVPLLDRIMARRVRRLLRRTLDGLRGVAEDRMRPATG